MGAGLLGKGDQTTKEEKDNVVMSISYDIKKAESAAASGGKTDKVV